MNNQTFSLSTPKEQGTVVLLTVVLLLVLVTLVTLYTGKIQSFEHRIIINDQNQKRAKGLAKAGIERNIAFINATKTLTNYAVMEKRLDKSHFSVEVNQKALSVFNSKSSLLTLTSTGSSADGLATATVIEQFLLYPILHNAPVAPLIVQDGFNSRGKFIIATNPDGRGNQHPLSVWSDKEVVLSDTLSQSCIRLNFNFGQCQTQVLSNGHQKEMDIFDTSNTFPADLMSYLFNIPIANWNNVKQLATFHYNDCQSLDHNSVGLIWVSGTCRIGLAQKVATKARPAILVVSEGDIKLDKAAIVYGLVFSFKPPSSLSNLQVDMQAEAAVEGALVANYQLGNNNETIRVLYNSEVLAALTTQTELQALARVPGSWRDF